MGQIQQSLGNLTQAALGGAIGIKASEAAKSSKESTELQREQAKFNAEMNAAELPAREAEAELNKYEATSNEMYAENSSTITFSNV